MSLFYELSAKTLDGTQFKFSELKNKVVLIENTASLWGTTVRDFTQMNDLSEKYGDKLVILAFPTNQFGHQENSSGEEIINCLKYVRPGNGFEPKCIVFDKVSVNGEGEHPVFSWLKSELPIPSDDEERLMRDPKFIIWKPVKRSDIAWNFEKFLIDKKGKAYRRYSKNYQTADISKDIQLLLIESYENSYFDDTE